MNALSQSLRKRASRWAGQDGAGRSPSRLQSLVRPAGRYQWVLRIASLVVVVYAATSGAVGGFALTSLDTSIANAPLLSSSSGDTEVVVQGLASDGPADPPPAEPDAGVSSSDQPAPDAGDGDGPLAFLDEMPRHLTAGEVRILAREAGWPESRLDEVVAVARCESNLNPRARNAGNSSVYGLMQVHRLWFDHAGISLGQWHNPLVNLRVALAAFNYDIARGNAAWNQWVCKPWGHAQSAGAGSAPAADTPVPSPTPVPDTPTPLPTATPVPELPAGDDATATPSPSAQPDSGDSIDSEPQSEDQGEGDS